MLYTNKIQGNLPVKVSNILPSKDKIYKHLKESQEKLYHDQHTKELPPFKGGLTYQRARPKVRTLVPSQGPPQVQRTLVICWKIQEDTRVRLNRQHLKGDKSSNSLKKAKENKSVEKGPELITETPKEKSYMTGSGRITKMPKRYLNDSYCANYVPSFSAMTFSLISQISI